MTKTYLLSLSLAFLGTVISYAEKSQSKPSPSGQPPYLFSSFRNNGGDGLHLAYSLDGLQWTALKSDKSFLKPVIGGKLMRDPCIIQGPDKLFHMVWTTSWSDNGIGIAHSKDLIKWSEQKFLPVMEHEPKARNCWAPEITWDPDGKQYVIYWATTLPEKFKQTAKAADQGWNHRIYFTKTKDFKTYSKTKLFYEPGFNVIDSTIVKDGDDYVMVLKDETLKPPAKELYVAISKKITGPWKLAPKPFSPKWVEGPTCLKVGDSWMVYYDKYKLGKYGVLRTKDFKHWENLSEKLTLPNGTRHGTTFPVSEDILNQLKQEIIPLQ